MLAAEASEQLSTTFAAHLTIADPSAVMHTTSTLQGTALDNVAAGLRDELESTKAEAQRLEQQVFVEFVFGFDFSRCSMVGV